VNVTIHKKIALLFSTAVALPQPSIFGSPTMVLFDKRITIEPEQDATSGGL
jgi:hypothetical protein